MLKFAVSLNYYDLYLTHFMGENRDYVHSVHQPIIVFWLTLREESGLRVFENRVLGRIFGPKGDEVTGE
jgi:hypothetical protein